MKKILWITIIVLAVSCSKNTEQNNKSTAIKTAEAEKITMRETPETETTDEKITEHKKADIIPVLPCGGYINDDNLRIRGEPNTNAEILGMLNLGDYVTVIDITKEKTAANNLEDYWYKITANENITGWIFGEYLELMLSSIPDEFKGKNWNSYFGNLSPIENFTLNDLQSCSWQRNGVILIFSHEGNYAGMGRGHGYDYGRYALKNNTVHFFPPINIVRFAEKYTISSLHYSNELYYSGAPVLVNDDETVVFYAHNLNNAKVGEIVKLHQHYCEKIWEEGKVNTNGVLYSLPDMSSKNMFQDNYYGRKATEKVAVKHAKTTIDDVVWYYTSFDFTSGDPIDGGGPFYDGWLPENYFE